MTISWLVMHPSRAPARQQGQGARRLAEVLNLFQSQERKTSSGVVDSCRWTVVHRAFPDLAETGANPDAEGSDQYCSNPDAVIDFPLTQGDLAGALGSWTVTSTETRRPCEARA
jgi:hypothetical protein